EQRRRAGPRRRRGRARAPPGHRPPHERGRRRAADPPRQVDPRPAHQLSPPAVARAAMTDGSPTGDGSGPVRLSFEGDVAVIDLDDGKANAISFAVLDALEQALDRAATEARALVLAGREGRFSAGFDLSVIGGDRTVELLTR